MGSVLRTVSALALLVVVAAGCGGAAHPQSSAFHGVPPALADDWEGKASSIAAAAAAGNGCRALLLANALRSDVIVSEHRLPPRLRLPLLIGVNALADRITCTVPPQTVTAPPAPPAHPKPKPKPQPPKHGHDHHGPGGDG